MVQNVSNQGVNPYGSVNRVGMTNDGRVIYQVVDGTGKEAGKMTISQQDCDVFEKSYHDILESAPKIQKYAQTHSSPDDIKNRKKKSRWILGLSALAGLAAPIYLTRKLGTVAQVLATAVGLVAGLTGGFALSVKATTPPGTMKFAKATERISKLDIKPYIEA